MTITMSPSRMGMWIRCQAQYYFAYIEGLRRPPSASLAFGRAFDGAADYTYQHKIDDGKIPLVTDSMACFRDHFADEAEAVEDWGENDLGSLIDNGVALTSHWHTEIAQKRNPVEVQKPFEAKLKGPDGQIVEVRGKVDLVEPDIKIDTKTAAKSWNVKDAIRSLQAICYATVFGDNAFQFDVAVKTKKPKTQVIRRPVLDTEKRMFAVTAAMTERQIEVAMESGDFMPNRSHVMCSQSWCGFWEHCEKKYGGKVPE